MQPPEVQPEALVCAVAGGLQRLILSLCALARALGSHHRAFRAQPTGRQVCGGCPGMTEACFLSSSCWCILRGSPWPLPAPCPHRGPAPRLQSLHAFPHLWATPSQVLKFDLAISKKYDY